MDRVVEIVSYVIRQYLTKPFGESGPDQEMVEELFRLGYTRQEVETAISIMCLLPNRLDAKIDEEHSIGLGEGYRVFSPIEKKKFSIAFQGEIFRLMNSSLLSREELEKVISEASQRESNEVGLRELESILHKVINDEERLLMILQFPLGNGSHLFLN